MKVPADYKVSFSILAGLSKGAFFMYHKTAFILGRCVLCFAVSVNSSRVAPHLLCCQSRHLKRKLSLTRREKSPCDTRRCVHYCQYVLLSDEDLLEFSDCYFVSFLD